MNSRHAVVLQCDRNYFFALAVVVASLCESHTSSTLMLNVAAEGFSSDDRSHIESLAGKHEVRWLEIDAAALADIQVPPGLHRAALSRFLLSDALPAELERVLYLDVDLLVTDDLGDLFEVSLPSGDVVAAVRDAFIDTFWAPKGPPLDLGPQDVLAPYFNAGVLLIDLGGWRQRTISQRCLALLRARSLMFMDQCAQNVVLAGAWTRLHPRWNVQTRHFAPSGAIGGEVQGLSDLAEAVRHPAIVHFTSTKPWQLGCEHPMAERWWAVAEQTGVAPPRPAAETHGRSSLAPGHSMRSRTRDLMGPVSRVARRLGVTVAWRRDTELDGFRRLVAQRTDGVVSAGPFRGTRLLGSGEMPSLGDLRDLLGVTGAGLVETSRLLRGGDEPATLVVRGELPNVLRLGLATLWPSARAASVPEADLVVVTVPSWSAVGASPIDSASEVWVAIKEGDSPSDVAAIAGTLQSHFDIVLTEPPTVGAHLHSLARDLRPDAAERLRGLLTLPEVWMVAVRR